jgi:hypothetical protein
MGKSQHYVSKFLLKNFSEDIEGRQINVYNINSDECKYDVSLKKQAQNDYIYGKDQEIEFFFQLIETKASNVIARIINTPDNLALDDNEKRVLQEYIHFQLGRTPFDVNLNKELATKLFKSMYKNDPKYKKHIDDFEIEFKEPFQHSVALREMHTGLLADLKIAILTNETKIPFVLGQHPAIIINPYLYEKRWKASSQGIGLIGTCILLPVSFAKVILLYDKDCYKIINDKERKISIPIDDVYKINKFQFYYTSNCIYFKRGMDQNYFKAVADETEYFRKGEKIEVIDHELFLEMTKIPNDNPSLLFLRIKAGAFCRDLIPTKEGMARPTIRDLIMLREIMQE